MAYEIKSVNWHITTKCNYKCKFCYIQNLNDETLEISTANKIFEKLKSLHIEKINFVGGEPLLNPQIFNIMKIAKKMGFTVSITTNGSLLNKKIINKLSSYVDWIGISIDSADELIEKKLGRGFGNHVKHVEEISKYIKTQNIKLKLNTTVTKYTVNEDMKTFVGKISPDRWKVFQFLHIKGQNDYYVSKLSVTDEEFDHFKKLNEKVELSGEKKPVFENCNAMLDSYFMISPSGNIILNHNGVYNERLLDSINFDNIADLINPTKYYARGGLYDWN